MRIRNKGYYRVLHWPIWIWVFFLAPGPLVFSLFAHGFSVANGVWLALVLLGTGIAAFYGQLPGSSQRPTSCASMKTAPILSIAKSATPLRGMRRSTSRC